MHRRHLLPTLLAPFRREDAILARERTDLKERVTLG